MENYIISQLLRLISIPSVSGRESDILFYIEEEIERIGLDYERQKVEGSYYNVLVGDVKKPRWVVCTHVDTVAPIDLMPPRAEIKNDRIYGLGACDVKSGISVMLALLKEFKELIEEKGILFAFLVDEEKDGRGSKELSHYLSNIEGIKGAIVIEPTNMELAIREAGSIEVMCFVEGKWAHGSCPEAGDNAIIKAIDLIKEFDKLPFLEDRDEFLGVSTYNVLYFNGGSEELRVPAKAKFLVDFRIMPARNTDEAVGSIVSLFKKYGVTYEFRDISGGFAIDESEEVVRLLGLAYEEVLGSKPVLGGMKSWTDAENLYTIEIPPVVFGPGRLEDAHTPWENVAIKDLLDFHRVLRRFVEIV